MGQWIGTVPAEESRLEKRFTHSINEGRAVPEVSTALDLENKEKNYTTNHPQGAYSQVGEESH